MSSSPWRRVMAAVMALAFLIVGVADVAHHLDGTSAAIAMQAQGDQADSSSDAPAKAGIGIDHCHGCMMAAVPAAPDILAVDLPASPPSAPPRLVRPHQPGAETRPPIATI